MLRVGWPAQNTSKRATIWRLLDLSGMTRSVRNSRNYTRAGYVFLDGRNVRSLSDTVPLGKTIVLEIRFPNGKIRSQEMMVVPVNRTTQLVRSNSPRQLNYKG